MKTKPIFLFSLPRSGSTLLQRMLANSKEISTSSELWFLLPHIHALLGKRVCAEYSAKSAHKATEILLEQLPNGADDYYEAIRCLADSIYSSLAANDEKYVLDKTPRYYFIVNEIEKLYPDGKFIFLFRHPLAVLASLVESFYRNRLGDYWHRIDMYEGPRLLAEGYKKFSSHHMVLTYEDLVTNPDKNLRNICDYLEIQFHSEMVSDFTNNPVDGFGDKFGSKRFAAVDTSSIEKWKKVFGTPYRKKYILKYMDYLGKDIVEMMGYEFEEIMVDAQSMPVRFNLDLTDRYCELISRIYSMFEIPLLKDKAMRRFRSKNKLYIHH